MSPSVASLSSLFLLVLLLSAQYGGSSHASYKLELGSRQIFFSTPGNSQQASTVPPATADVLRPDASLNRRHLITVCAGCPGTTIPVNGSLDLSTLPSALDYSVLVGYGTPEQHFAMYLDTTGIGASLRCKPCASGSKDCNPAFDPSRSSTFAHVLCGSPDYPTNCSSGSPCLFHDPFSKIEGTFAQDMLTLASSRAVHGFRFVCMDMEEPSDLPEARILDLSRDPNSLPMHLSSSEQGAAAFSYCLPHSTSSQGFLSVDIDANIKDLNFTAHAPLVSHGEPGLARMYFIHLVGMSLGVEDLQIPAQSFGNLGSNLDVGTTFTKLMPDVYTPLRDSFRKQMSHYNRSVVGFHGFDTCFNFTGPNELVIPFVRFKFSNGETLLIDRDRQMYYDDPAASPFTMACLAFSRLESGDFLGSVIGTYTLASMAISLIAANMTTYYATESMHDM